MVRRENICGGEECENIISGSSYGKLMIHKTPVCRDCINKHPFDVIPTWMSQNGYKDKRMIGGKSK